MHKKMEIFNPLTSKYASQVYFDIGETLCLKTEMADIYFIFNSKDGSCERVPAHTFLLMAASSVFRKLFKGAWKGKDEVEIVDVPVDAFKEFLQFFYLGCVQFTDKNIVHVMNLGNKYNVTGCMKVCSEFLRKNLNDDNVCLCYGLAILFNQQDLKQACETVIGLNTNAVLKSTDFLVCHHKVLAQILKANWLSCSEVELFEACVSWVKAAAKQEDLTKEMVQAQLGDAFNDIRFESMLVQELAKLISKYDMFFTRNQYTDFFQMIAENESKLDEKVGKRDLVPWNDTDLIECNRLCSTFASAQGYFIKDLETTKFSSNETLLLKKFALSPIYIWSNGQRNTTNDIPTEITIFEVFYSEMSNITNTGENCSIASSEVSELSKNEIEIYNGQSILKSECCLPEDVLNNNVVLSKPILIRPGFMYEIRLKQTAPEKCEVGGVMKTEVQMKDGINIQFHDDPIIPYDTAPTGLVLSLSFYPISK